MGSSTSHDRKRPIRNDGVAVAFLGHLLMDTKRSVRKVTQENLASQKVVFIGLPKTIHP